MDSKQWKEVLEKGKLNEATMSTDDFVKQIESVIKKHFPKSFSQVEFGGRFEPSIHIVFALGQKNDWSGGYFENDIVSNRMFIWGFEKSGKMKDKLQFDPSGAGSFVIKPGPDSYMAYDRVKVPVRKKTGSPDQILKSIDKYFGDLKKALKSNVSNFSKDHEYAKKYI